MYKRILLPISGKKRGHKAIDALGRALHVSEKGEFILLHVTPPVTSPGNSDGQEETRQAEAQAMLLMGPAIEYLRADGRKFYTRVVAGNPAECISRVADEENADLIIMLNDGGNEAGGMAPGCKTERVLRDTTRDVLVLRP